MPRKINMVISNNTSSMLQQKQLTIPQGVKTSRTIPTALNGPLIARIHNVRAGCGSCGR